jgi:hypothetical protein
MIRFLSPLDYLLTAAEELLEEEKEIVIQYSGMEECGCDRKTGRLEVVSKEGSENEDLYLITLGTENDLKNSVAILSQSLASVLSGGEKGSEKWEKSLRDLHSKYFEIAKMYGLKLEFEKKESATEEDDDIRVTIPYTLEEMAELKERGEEVILKMYFEEKGSRAKEDTPPQSPAP